MMCFTLHIPRSLGMERGGLPGAKIYSLEVFCPRELTMLHLQDTLDLQGDWT